jgi:hypothetical protein
MHYLVRLRLHTRDLSVHELWTRWDRLVMPDLPLVSGAAYPITRIVGQDRLVMLLELESREEAETFFTGTNPLAHYLEIEEVLPVQPYPDPAEKSAGGWSGTRVENQPIRREGKSRPPVMIIW